MNVLALTSKAGRFAALAGRAALAAIRRDPTYDGPPLFERVEWIVCARNLRDSPSRVKGTPAHGMTVVTSADDPLLELLPVPRQAPARHALARGDFAVFATNVDGTLVGHIWVAFTSYVDRVTGVRVRLGPGECWGYDVRVATEHRGSLIARALVATAMSECARRGHPAFYAAFDRRNRPSLALFRLFDMVHIQTVWSITMLDRFGLQVRATPRRRPASRSSVPLGLSDLTEPRLESLRDILRESKNAPAHRRFAGRRGAGSGND